MDLNPDRSVVLRTRRGDTNAFGTLVERYQRSVFNVCYRLMGDTAEAEDLAQEAFLRAIDRLGTFDTEKPFGPWIRKVAANLCINQLNRRSVHSVPLDDERDQAWEGHAPGVEAMVSQSDRAEAIRQAVLDLPDHYKVVIELRHFHDLSYAEIAEFLKIPLSDVKSHLFRARKQLALKLERQADA